MVGVGSAVRLVGPGDVGPQLSDAVAAVEEAVALALAVVCSWVGLSSYSATQPSLETTPNLYPSKRGLYSSNYSTKHKQRSYQSRRASGRGVLGKVQS